MPNPVKSCLKYLSSLSPIGSFTGFTRLFRMNRIFCAKPLDGVEGRLKIQTTYLRLAELLSCRISDSKSFWLRPDSGKSAELRPIVSFTVRKLESERCCCG